MSARADFRLEQLPTPPWMASRRGLITRSLVSWIRSQVAFSRQAGQRA